MIPSWRQNTIDEAIMRIYEKIKYKFCSLCIQTLPHEYLIQSRWWAPWSPSGVRLFEFICDISLILRCYSWLYWNFLVMSSAWHVKPMLWPKMLLFIFCSLCICLCAELRISCAISKSSCFRFLHIHTLFIHSYPAFHHIIIIMTTYCCAFVCECSCRTSHAPLDTHFIHRM